MVAVLGGWCFPKGSECHRIWLDATFRLNGRVSVAILSPAVILGTQIVGLMACWSYCIFRLSLSLQSLSLSLSLFSLSLSLSLSLHPSPPPFSFFLSLPPPPPLTLSCPMFFHSLAAWASERSTYTAGTVQPDWSWTVLQHTICAHCTYTNFRCVKISVASNHGAFGFI